MSRLTRDGTAEPVSRDQILRRERRQGNAHFPCPAHHEQDWQPYPVDPYSCYICVTMHSDVEGGIPDDKPAEGEPTKWGADEGTRLEDLEMQASALTRQLIGLVRKARLVSARPGRLFSY